MGIKLDLKVKDDIKLTAKSVEIPDLTGTWEETSNIVICTDDYKKYKGKFTYYEKYIDDYRPQAAVKPGYEIWDIKGQLIPCYDMNTFGIDLVITNYQYVMLFFLQRYFSTKNKAFLYFYKEMENMIADVEKEVAKLNLSDELLYDMQKILPFFITDSYFGCCNWSSSHIKYMIETRERIDNVPMKDRTVFRERFGYYPANYETPSKDNWDEINIDEYNFMKFSGKKIDSLFAYQL